MVCARLALDLIDPRGRCNRRGLLVAAVLLLAVEAVAGVCAWASETPLDGPLAFGFKAAMVVVAFSSTAKRLHDCGMSAWRIPAAVVAIVTWAFVAAFGFVAIGGAEMVQPETPLFWLVFLAVMLPVLAAALWLHCREGEAQANRHGPVPTARGFSAPQPQERQTVDAADRYSGQQAAHA